MAENPYAPLTVSSSPPPKQRNTLARIGFALSLLGVVSLSMVGAAAEWGGTIGMVGQCLPFSCLPGLLLSLLAMLTKPRSPAGWGVFLGIVGCLYLPTISIGLRFGS